MKRSSSLNGAILVLGICGLAGISPTHAATQQGAAMAPADLDKVVAPIALYPDQLLAPMFVCAGTPAEVTKLDGWLKTNPPFKGTALQEAATQSGFTPPCVALALFPQVVDFMTRELEWTTALGRAFASDRNGVTASVQRLRSQAQKAGTLKSTPQQTVETVTTSSGGQAIVIEPANSQIVYVPQYNAQTVYTQAPATNTTIVIEEDDDDDDAAIAAGVIGFTAGIAIGAAIDNDYYYGPYGWGGAPRMYNDAWDDWADNREDAREDYYEHREDAREDYQDRREDVSGERTERSANTQQERTERQQNRQENPQTQQRRSDAQAAAQSRGTTQTAESRGRSTSNRATTAQRSGGGSDAFSGYSSGRSERSASSRGQSSRGGGSRGGGSRGGGGGRRR